MAAVAGAAVAAAVAAIVIAGPLRSAEPASAASQVAEAAARTGDTSALRATVQYSDGRPAGHALVEGEDVQITQADSDTFTIVDGQSYTTDANGKVTHENTPASELPAPFAQTSEQLVQAAISSGDVTEIGEEPVRGQMATRYSITIDAAAKARLAQLTPGVLGWFDLEYPDSVEAMDVWVADGLIRQVRVSQSLSGQPPLISTTEFYDFGDDDIAVSRPR